MDKELEHVIEEALHLSPENRMVLAETVLDSLPEDPVMKEWLDEVERRSGEWDRGIVVGVDPGAMLADARAMILSAPAGRNICSQAAPAERKLRPQKQDPAPGSRFEF